MPKVELDASAFKILASDTRLDILKSLDQRKMTLEELATRMKLKKATIYEHLTKMTSVELVKRHERSGHKWIYYDLSWKAKCLLHPETGRVAVLISTTFFTLAVGLWSMITFFKNELLTEPIPMILKDTEIQIISITRDSMVLAYVSIVAFLFFGILLIVTRWKMEKNKKSLL